MKLQPILDDIQNGLNIFQQKVNIIRTLDTGKFYEVDLQMTRKEAAEFIGRSASRFGQNLPPTESIQPENLSPFTSVQWTLSATETND